MSAQVAWGDALVETGMSIDEVKEDVMSWRERMARAIVHTTVAVVDMPGWSDDVD